MLELDSLKGLKELVRVRLREELLMDPSMVDVFVSVFERGERKEKHESQLKVDGDYR